MTRSQIKPLLITAILAVYACNLPAQAPPPVNTAPQRLVQPQIRTIEQPDAERTRGELWTLLQRYPPAVRETLQIDSGLLENESWLSSYPALAAFLNTHPDIARNPRFFVGEQPNRHRDPAAERLEISRDVVTGIGVFTGFGMGIGLLAWLIRTLIDYRRWIRLAKVQTDVHTKLVDRFTANEDLLAYIQSPAGSRFLQSTPIALDAVPRTAGAPMSRILWSIQGGVVLFAGGVGLQLVGRGQPDEGSAQSLHALGVLAMALGLGFLISAVISFVISRRLGLYQPVSGIPGRTDHVS